MPISNELKRIYASAPSDRRYIETLSIAHSAFPATFYINNAQAVWRFMLEDARLVDFNPVPFQLVWPTVDSKGHQDLQLVIDNVGRDAMDAIEAAAASPQEPIEVTVRVYLNVADSPPQNAPPLKLSLSEIHVTKEAVTGTAMRADVLNRLFPSLLYRTDTYPGLDR